MAHAGAPTAQAAQGGPRMAAAAAATTPSHPRPPGQQPAGAAPQYNPPPPQQYGAPPNERSEQKRNLATWWNNFKRSDKKPQDERQSAPQGIFGIPLQESIRYANVAISLFDDAGESYIYGYVPIVVAKCGVYLKEKATDVEGIFRLAGSEKRIKELKVQFDSPDRYGKGLDWTGYTVHDAANILRRYFNQLPEPIIPLDFYDRFRDPLRNHQAQAVGELEAQSPSVGHFDQDAAIRRYQSLITELPPLNRQLLLYILDLLAVFASKSDLNKMTTANLSAIFQPGILSHPQHDMAPPEYRLSQDVLIFLIENQDSFLIGMQGTAADPETVREVQSGSPSKPPATPTTPSRSKTIVGRSTSNASAGAESVGKFGSIRRNASLSSSKRSKRSDGGPTVVAGVVTDPGTPSSGVHRSNTVPSRRGGSNAASPRFSRDNKSSDPTTPSPANSSKVAVNTSKPRQESLQSTPVTTTAPTFPAAPGVISASSSEVTTPLAPVGNETPVAASREYQTPKKDTTPLLSPPGGSGERRSERSPSNTPSGTSGRALLDIFKQSPGSDSDGRKPNKLQKKRIPGSALSSAQSSNHDLQQDGIQDIVHQSPITSNFAAAAAVAASQKGGEESEYTSAQATPTGTGTGPATGSTLQAPMQEPSRRVSGENTLRPTISPTHSYNSATESDADMVGDDLPKEQAAQPEKEKKRHRWRFSRSNNKLDPNNPAQQPSSPGGPGATGPLGTMAAQEQAMSRSTVGSSNTTGLSQQGAQPRRSFQEPTPLLTSSATDPSAGQAFAATTPASPPMPPQYAGTDPVVFSDSERERKGPMSWLRGKFKDGKERERESEKRARTPERGGGGGSKGDLGLPAGQASGGGVEGRGKSFEVPRAGSGGGATGLQTSPHAVTAAQAAVERSSTQVSPTAAATAGGGTVEGVTSGETSRSVEDAAAAPSPAVPMAGANGTGGDVGQAVVEGRMGGA